MTQPHFLPDTPTPFHRRTDYVAAVLELYVALPQTPQRSRPDDRFFARQLLQQNIPLLVVEAGLLLAAARRIFRPPEDPLAPVRSLRYFSHAIEEVQEELRKRMDFESLAAYANYLRSKVPLSSPTQIPSPGARARTKPPTKSKKPVQLRFNW